MWVANEEEGWMEPGCCLNRKKVRFGGFWGASGKSSNSPPEEGKANKTWNNPRELSNKSIISFQGVCVGPMSARFRELFFFASVLCCHDVRLLFFNWLTFFIWDEDKLRIGKQHTDQGRRRSTGKRPNVLFAVILMGSLFVLTGACGCVGAHVCLATWLQGATSSWTLVNRIPKGSFLYHTSRLPKTDYIRNVSREVVQDGSMGRGIFLSSLVVESYRLWSFLLPVEEPTADFTEEREEGV